MMMMEHMEPVFLGLSWEVLFMLASGVFYIICAALLLKPLREEPNELISALFAFLAYQAVSMVFMGLEMHTMQMIYSNIAALAVFIGSAYMLKFPFSSFAERTRRIIFFVSLIVVLGLFVWFMQTDARQMVLFNFTLWYDIIVNGIVVGGFMFLLAIRTTERWFKVKAFGGSSGVVACCVVANATMLGGAFFVSSVFQFLAPVIIIGSLLFARKKQKETDGMIAAV